jgi:NAD(P)-dependent dehydrogenase (short-subunit alcohol dehydrogenase family)
MAHPNRLNNAHVLVFGGTSGIGLGVASMAASYGAFVTISGSRQPKVDDNVENLRKLYPNVDPSKINGVACDLGDTANLETNLAAFFDKVTKNGEYKVDHIVFTAGDAINLPQVATVTVDQVTPKYGIRVIAPMIIGKILTTGKYVPQTPASSLTLTGGTNTAKPMPGWSVAAGIGSSIEGLTRGLAVDLAPIRVNTVSAGAIVTPLSEGWLKSLGEEGKAQMIKTTTLVGKLGHPEDIAEAYGWFMKDHFTTGVIASSDGGRILT